MEYSTIRTIANFCLDTINCADWREVAKSINDGQVDFEVEEYRFISADAIDAIQQDELSSDLYVLGCFNVNFLGDILGVGCQAVRAIQEAEAFEALGTMVIEMGKLEELQQEYASADGYGHHFNHYDGEQHFLTVDGKEYLVFQIN